MGLDPNQIFIASATVAYLSAGGIGGVILLYHRYFGPSQIPPAEEAPTLHNPYADLQARSLLDNYDLILIEQHLCALRFVLPNFHMERNMPIFRIEMGKIESAVIYLAKTGVKHVAHLVKEALDVSLSAEAKEGKLSKKAQNNVSKEFHREIKRCRTWIALMIGTTKEVLENYEKIIAFIIDEAHPYSPEEHETGSIYDLLKGQRRYDPVNVRKVMDLGWKGYLVSSGHQLLKDRGVMLDGLNQMFRFAYALSNMTPRNLKEKMHPNSLDWEIKDRAVLCQSIEVTGDENGLIWILATESLGGRVEEPGPRYLSWYNDVDASNLVVDVHNNENALSEAVQASLAGTRDRITRAAVDALFAQEANNATKRHFEEEDESLTEREFDDEDGEEAEEEEEKEGRAQGTKRRRFTTYYNEEWPMRKVQAPADPHCFW